MPFPIPKAFQPPDLNIVAILDPLLAYQVGDLIAAGRIQPVRDTHPP